MSIKSKISVILFMVIGLILIFNSKVFASSVSVSAPSSVTPGATFSVTVTGNDAIGKFAVSVSGGSTSTSSIWVEPSATFSVTAGNSGSVSVSVSASNVSNAAGTATVNPSGSVNVSIQSNSGGNSGGINNSGSASGNNNGNTTTTGKKITSLGITPLEYDFSNYKVGAASGTTYYAKNVPNSVTSISIYANGATSGTGTKTLKEGTNKFTVSNDTYTYYIVVNRATSDESEEPTNKPDDEERDEEEETGIGLKSLVIEGYEFDKEFDPNIFEYKVKVETPLTLEELNKIKDLLKAELNTEGVEFEVVAEISEEKGATITITVKDEEKEYSKYVITFEAEPQEEDTVIGAVVPPSNNSKLRGMFGLTEEQQIYAILGAFGLTFLIAVTYCIVSYVQHKKLLEYTEGEYVDDNFEEYYGVDEDSPTVIEQLYKDRNSNVMGAELQEEDIPNSVKNLKTAQIENVENTEKTEEPLIKETISDTSNSENVIEKAIDYERKLFSARSLRSGRRAGKH